jgi:hypothetical protein
MSEHAAIFRPELFEDLVLVDGSLLAADFPQVAHAFVPGGGRDATGMHLSALGLDRVDAAAVTFVKQNMPGYFVQSGGNTPADTRGEQWLPPGAAADQRPFVGRPEAYSMDRRVEAINPVLLHRHGRQIPAQQRQIEPFSLDSVTNITQAEASQLFGKKDERPVAIFTQEAHLERCLKIARRTLRREFLGVVVPEVGVHNRDNLAAKLATQGILLGVSNRVTAEVANRRATRNARVVWRTVTAAHGLLGRGNVAYMAEN